jgi:hypothetical protein
MGINKQHLITSLDELAFLFKQMKEKHAGEKTSEDQQIFMENLERIIEDYRTLKFTIPEEIVAKFGRPIQEMAIQLIGLLKKDLDYTEPRSSQLSNIIRIDQMLQDPQIGLDEMDRLLDRRSELQSN